MTVVRCTRKLLRLLASSPMTSNMEPADDDWYADLLWLGGRKCLLMTHAATLFSVFEPEISKASVNPIGPLAVRLIERELASEDLPPDTFGPLQASAFTMGRTSSRSVLGTMTDMRHQIAAAAHQSGGLGDIDIRSLNRSLRRIPFSAIRYERPIDRARALLDGTTGESAPLSVEPAQAPDRIEDLFARFLAERRKELSTKGIKTTRPSSSSSSTTSTATRTRACRRSTASVGTARSIPAMRLLSASCSGPTRFPARSERSSVTS